MLYGVVVSKQMWIMNPTDIWYISRSILFMENVTELFVLQLYLFLTEAHFAHFLSGPEPCSFSFSLRYSTHSPIKKTVL